MVRRFLRGASRLLDAAADVLDWVLPLPRGAQAAPSIQEDQDPAPAADGPAVARLSPEARRMIAEPSPSREATPPPPLEGSVAARRRAVRGENPS